MPFESEAQRRFMYSQHPEIAKEFEKATPKGADLPEHVKKMADGGRVDAQDEPGMPDATVNDFLLPYLLSPASMAEGAGAKLASEAGQIGINKAAPEAAKEAGEIAINKLAPKMEGAAEEAAPKIEAYVKGIQKGPSGDIKIWGVKGDPAEIEKLGYGPDPGSVPEHILEQKGLLPRPEVDIPQSAPNAYADGGIIENIKKLFGSDKSDVQKALDVDPDSPAPAAAEPPKTSTDTAKGYDKGGVPGVTFMENQSPEATKKTVHLAASPKMAKGGEVPNEKKMHEVYKAMGIKKYADGGEVDAPAPSGLPTPSPSDPTYWDQIKAALAKVSAPVTGAISAATAPLQAVGQAVMPAVPPAVSAVNKLTGADIPVPPAAPAAIDPMAGLPPPAQELPPVAAPMPPVAAGAPSATSAHAPDLTKLFNQDTSKLTAGVNPEDRQALANTLQAKQHNIGSIIAQAVAGLGDALAAKGGRDQHSLQNIYGMQKEQRDEALANFDKARQDRLQKVALQTQLGQNAVQQLAAQDAYGTDEHLNAMLGAPKGTMHKDIPLYFQMKSAQVAQQEKDADLYMKAHSQAASEVDAAIKNASVFNIKPSPAQIQASGNKLADQYYNRAKGNLLVKPSDGGPSQWIPAVNLPKAKQMDPHLQIQQ